MKRPRFGWPPPYRCLWISVASAVWAGIGGVVTIIWLGDWVLGVCAMSYAVLGGWAWGWASRLMRQRDEAREARDDLRARLVDQLMVDVEEGLIRVFYCSDCPADGTAEAFGDRSLGEEER